MAGRKTLAHLMKIKSTPLFVGFLVGSIAIGQAQAAPFTMTCKSGRNMKLTFEQWNGPEKLRLKLYFKKAAKGANERPPSFGECAWSHRPLNAREKSPLHSVTNGHLRGNVNLRKEKLRVVETTSGVKKLLNYVSTPNKLFSMVVSLNYGELTIKKVL